MSNAQVTQRVSKEKPALSRKFKIMSNEFSEQTRKVAPFSKAFVATTTMRHMQNAIDISTRKSVARLQDFDGQSSKGVEILETLSLLATMSKLLEEFKVNNQQIFQE